MSWESLPAELAIAAFVVLALGVLLQAIAKFIAATKAPRSTPSPPPQSTANELNTVHRRLESTEGHLEKAVTDFAQAVARFEEMRGRLATADALDDLAADVQELETKVDSALTQIAELRGEVRARYGATPPPTMLSGPGE